MSLLETLKQSKTFSRDDSWPRGQQADSRVRGKSSSKTSTRRNSQEQIGCRLQKTFCSNPGENRVFRRNSADHDSRMNSGQANKFYPTKICRRKLQNFPGSSRKVDQIHVVERKKYSSAAVQSLPSCSRTWLVEEQKKKKKGFAYCYINIMMTHDNTLRRKVQAFYWLHQLSTSIFSIFQCIFHSFVYFSFWVLQGRKLVELLNYQRQRR